MPPVPPPPTFDPELMMQFMKNGPMMMPTLPFMSNTPEKSTINDYASKPKLTEDLMNDLERLKDVELIDLLDDTTKSILDSLKSLQLQYGIHLDGLDVDNDIECSRRAAELLKSDNKATLYSSLTNLLKRDCSSGSILSMHSLSERHPEDSCELTEEKVNLIRSLSNLLKAESCISATIQSQSRSRLNSFTTSEKSCRVRLNSETENPSDVQSQFQKDEETTPRVSPVPPDEISGEEARNSTNVHTETMTEHKNSQQEEDEIDFWASIKSQDDELPPRRPLWTQRKSNYMEEPKVVDSERNLNEEQDTNTSETSAQEAGNDISSCNVEVDSQTKDVEVSKETVTVEVETESKDVNDQVTEYPPIETCSDPDQSLSTSETKIDTSSSCTSPHPTEDTMSIDIEQEIRDLHEYEAEHLDLPLDDIAPPEDFQDQKTPTSENQPDSIPTTQQPYSNWTPEQYAYMMQAMYHNYYANPANSALLANPVYYHQYLAYQQYMQNFYHQQSQAMNQQEIDGYDGDYAEQSDNSVSEWYDVSQQDQEPDSYYEDPTSEFHNEYHNEMQQAINEEHLQDKPELSDSRPVVNESEQSEASVGNHSHHNLIVLEHSGIDEVPEQVPEHVDHSAVVPKEDSPVEMPEIRVNALDDDPPLPQNIDLVVEDHTELLEEAIVEGKMLIIPSEIVTGDSSLSQDDEISTSCTVVTATTIEKRPVENRSNSNSNSEIMVYEIDDNQSPTVSVERQTSECESMGEEEQEVESLQNSEIVEEEPSEGEEGSEGDECDDIPPLTYFKNNVNEHLPHQLSVIFEVTEYSERASVRSSSVDSESDISHEITAPTVTNHVQQTDEDEIEDAEDVKVSISLPLRKSETKEEVSADVNFVVNLSPKGPSLERTYSGSRHNSIVEENDSDISVSVSLPLKRNKFSNVSLNVAEEAEEEEMIEPRNHNINDSFDAFESLDMDDEHMVQQQKIVEQPKPVVEQPNLVELRNPIEPPKTVDQLVQIKHQQMHPMQFTTDDSDTDSNMGDNEYETSAQSSSTMINEQSLSALSNLNNFMGLQTFSRASSVPPCSTNSDNKTDEAIQRRFQTLREQWGQLAKANNEVKDDDDNKGSSSWKITFFDANQDLFNKAQEAVDLTSSRPQSCLTIQQNERDDDRTWCRTERAKSEFADKGSVDSEEQETHVNWWPKRKVSPPKKSPEPQNTKSNDNWWPKRRVSPVKRSPDPVTIDCHDTDNSESGAKESWWPKRKCSPKKRSPVPQPPNAVTESDTATENWWPKNRVSPKCSLEPQSDLPTHQQDSGGTVESDENTNWWPKRKVNANTQKAASPKKISPPRSTKAETAPLKYRMVQVQALDSESDSMGDSDSEEEIESGTSRNSLSESSSNSWKKSSSKTLKPHTIHSNSSSSATNNYHSAGETTTSDYERARSCPRQGVISDRSTSVIREMPLVTTRPPRPGSCTREMEPKSENIRFIRASSVTRETTSLSRQSSQSFGASDVRSSPKVVKQEPPKFTFDQWANHASEKTWEEYIPPETDQSPMSDWINAQTLAFPERLKTPPRQYRSLSVARETSSPRTLAPTPYRPSSCTREMETVRPEKKTSSLYRQLSVNMESDAYRSMRQSPCSFTTHPERPTSCTLELDFCTTTVLTPVDNNNCINLSEIKIEDQRRESIDACQTDSTLDESANQPVSDPPVVLRRRVKRQPRPVSCAGELEKQSYRNSLEGSRLEALTEQCPVMPTVIEIHHTQPARPSSCTKELEGTWANKAKNRLQQRPRTRAHSVTREITLCTSPAPSSSSAHSEGTTVERRRRMSVRDRVNAIEEFNIYSATMNQAVQGGTHGRDPSVKSSIDESEADDDSGVQSSKYVSEVETDNEGFSELRKMTPYQRANTQTKLYQYLQECVSEEQEEGQSSEVNPPEPLPVPVIETRPKKIVHNVSATRRQNPEKIKEAETPQQRRQRLSLPLVHQHSSGIESVDSSVASPSSPVREKLVNELVQSLLLKKDGRQFRNIPLEKLHAAALKILEEEDHSHAPSTAYSTPAQTPSEFQLDSPCSYEDYHASWQQPASTEKPEDNYDYSVFPSKTFKRLHDQVCGGGVASGTIVRRGSLPRSPLLRSSPYGGSQDGATSNPYPHSHSPSPFGN